MVEAVSTHQGVAGKKCYQAGAAPHQQGKAGHHQLTEEHAQRGSQVAQPQHHQRSDHAREGGHEADLLGGDVLNVLQVKR